MIGAVWKCVLYIIGQRKAANHPEFELGFVSAEVGLKGFANV